MGDMLSQAEIDALLGGPTESEPEASDVNEAVFTKEQLDILTEIGVETMDVSANTLHQVLNQEVVIETPEIDQMILSSAKANFRKTSLGCRIDYKIGILGSSVLILDDKDARIVANLMMGGDGDVDDNGELDEIGASALCEAMNQMVGSSSTVLFKILGEKVDIDTPKLFSLEIDDSEFITKFGFDHDDDVVILKFPLKIGTLVDSNLIQVMPIQFAKKMIDGYKSKERETASSITKQISNLDKTQKNNGNQNNAQQQNGSVNNSQNPLGGGHMSSNQPYNGSQNNYQNVNAQPAQFQNFELSDIIQQKENISIIMDVPLEVTVEMGRTYKKIEEILEFSPGTIVELEKLAGDPIDILVNGKFVAKGEVVVIDENYGIRITSIINFKNRI